MKNTNSRFKKANIRIWIHQRDLENLQQVVWEGHGSKLLVEHSNNPKVKKFLECVPHLMGLIKTIHCDVINNDLESLKLHTSSPVPPVVLSGKDSNGLTALHKASGLGRFDMVQYIVSKNHEVLSSKDVVGRTALHYAPLAKDDNKMFDLLVNYGADEYSLDNRQKTAAYYKNKSSEIDPSVLQAIPECPRCAKQSFLDNWDWNFLTPSNVDGNKSVTNANTSTTDSKISATYEQESTTNENRSTIVEDKPATDANGSTTDENKSATSENKPTAHENKHAMDENKPTIDENKPTIDEDKSAADESISTMDENKATANRSESTKGLDTDETEQLKNKELSKLEECTLEEKNSLEQPHDTSNGDQKKSNNKSSENELQKHKEFLSDAENSQNETLEESNLDKQEEINKYDENIRNETRHDLTKVINNSETANNNKATTANTTDEIKDSNLSELKEQIPENKEQNAETGKSNEIAPVLFNQENLPLKDEVEPVGSEGVIEGRVNGENEVESVNNEGTKLIRQNSYEESETAVLVRSNSMEKLASLVLNGDGERLIGCKSENPEIQEFLNNVPQYMAKIHRIHIAARNGSLKDLQAALDRRKFATARDRISPDGATPLHVAIIFGNTSIVRYLAGRFPETVNTVDYNGRSPLHFAAVLDDNGHYYNLLVHLGANQNLEDKFGYIPEYYKTHRSDMSHKSLLRTFGGSDLVEEIWKDRDKFNSSYIDMPFFWTEEGRYLASSLGDPLIKGLTEVANKRPDDPVEYLASYLHNFAKGGDNTQHETQEEQQVNNNETVNEKKNEDVPKKQNSENITAIILDTKNDTGIISSFKSVSRDEHGQSILHFAAARSHSRNALFQLLEDMNINIAYRDELYRTARDISVQADITENTVEIDRYVLHIACKGDTDKLVELLLEGYDHIIDIIDEEGVPIIEAVSQKNQPNTVAFLQSILAFEEKRERVHYAIRRGNLNEVKDMLADKNGTGSGKLLAVSKNNYGRCSLHIAILCQQEEVVDYLVVQFPETMHVGDNLERTALHYAMGVEKIETISKVLIKAGAKRVAKDLKGRQPSYYFMNKSDILRLQEEEETF